MRSLILAFALALSFGAVPAASAHDVTKGGLMIVHPMSRPVMAGRTAAVYMAIANDGATDDRFLGARSPAFEAAELHESYEEGGVSKMRAVEVLEIPAGDTALLEPGGLHLMLIGAKRAVGAGETFPLVLIFEHAGEVEIPVMVDDMAGGGDGHGDHAMPTQ